MNKNYNEENKRMWPVYYDGRLWNKWECGNVFLTLYTSKISLRLDGAVYVGDGSWVFPNDTFEHDDNR